LEDEQNDVNNHEIDIQKPPYSHALEGEEGRGD